MGNVKQSKRDDDSIDAATIATDAQTRVSQIETALLNPTQLGTLVAAAVKDSVELKKQLSVTTLEFLDDYDNRKALEKIIKKIDRDLLFRWGKKVGGIILWIATVIGAVFAYVAIKK